MSPPTFSSLTFTIEGISYYHSFCRQLRFTDRELEVITHLSYGKNAEEIAAELVLSVSTIHKYLSNLRQKVNAKDTTHLVCIAFRSGLIS